MTTPMTVPVAPQKEWEKPTSGQHKLQIDNITIEKVRKFESDQLIDKYLFRTICRDQKDADGFPVSLINYFTMSLHVDSNLYGFLTTILFLDVRENGQTNEWSLDGGETWEEVDLNRLIGARFDGHVKQVTKKSGKPWTEIVAGVPSTLQIPNEEQQAAFIIRRDAMYEELKAAQKANAPAQAKKSVATAQKIQYAPKAAAPKAAAPKAPAAPVDPFTDELDSFEPAAVSPADDEIPF